MENTTGISLTKGEKIDLTKEAPGLVQASLGLGWDVNSSGGNAFDLDASAFMLGANGKLISDKGFVFFHNLKSPCGSVVHSGDNLTGQGDGDDETISVDLSKVPAEAEQILFVVNIYQADTRSQNFGQVKNAFIRLYDAVTKEQVLKYDLSEDFSSVTAVQFGRLYRHNGAWKFEATGAGEKAGLQAYLDKYK